MIRLKNSFLVVALGLLGWVPVLASDPPHNGIIECKSCHTLHGAPGAVLTAVAGNTNLCMSCHLPGGTASPKPFVALDQALPGPGLPTGVLPTGTSHRWDSGPAGHVAAAATNTSMGRILPLGAYTGPYAKTYTLTITSSGMVGAARFSWTATTPGGGSGSNVLTGVNVLLDQGVSAKFVDAPTGTSFQLNDQWTLYVIAGVRAPANPEMAVRLDNGQLMCSTCHDQHSQANKPFDPAASATYTPGVTSNRHFQRSANDTDQMCVDCHSSRDVTAATGGSHPVNVPLPIGAYQAPTTVPLDATANRVRCETCHKVHYAPSNDGTLTRASNNALCLDCHTLADTTTPARHLSASLGVLWPGGQYGSTLPSKNGRGLEGSLFQLPPTPRLAGFVQYRRQISQPAGG